MNFTIVQSMCTWIDDEDDEESCKVVQSCLIWAKDYLDVEVVDAKTQA